MQPLMGGTQPLQPRTQEGELRMMSDSRSASPRLLLTTITVAHDLAPPAHHSSVIPPNPVDGQEPYQTVLDLSTMQTSMRVPNPYLRHKSAIPINPMSPPQPAIHIPHAPILSPLEAYVEQGITRLDRHCQQWTAQMTREEDDFVRLEHRFQAWTRQQGARLPEWERQVSQKITTLGHPSHTLLMETEEKLNTLAVHAHQNVQAWLQVTKAQEIADYQRAMITMLQDNQRMEVECLHQQALLDLETDLDNFRSTARSLQIAWAQESPYVESDTMDHPQDPPRVYDIMDEATNREFTAPATEFESSKPPAQTTTDPLRESSEPPAQPTTTPLRARSLVDRPTAARWANIKVPPKERRRTSQA